MPFDGDVILKFYETPPGRYIIQGVVHSAVSAIVIRTIIKTWDISSPRLLQKFHIIPVILPPLGIILYYLLDPSRSSPERISGALLNIERILAIQYKGVSGGMIILLTLFLSTMIFIIQESIPVIKNIFISKREMEEKRIAQEYEVIFYGMRHRVKIIEEDTSVQKYC